MFAAFLAAFLSISHASAPPRFRVAVIGDLNGPYGSTAYRPEVRAAVERIVRLKPDLVLSVGDMVAGQDSSLTDQRVRKMWAAFHLNVSDPLERAGIPFAVTPGNHDASGYRQFRRDREIFSEEWNLRMPAVAWVDSTHYPFQYAFRLGGALFISLNATTVGPLDPAQRAWIEGILRTHRDAPVKILYGHVPPYPFAHGRESEFLGDPLLDRLMLEYHVTAHMSGHHHAYYPGERNGVRLVGLPCLGDGPRPLLGTASPSARGFAIFEIDGTAIRTLEAFAEPLFDSVIPRSSLPRSLGSGKLRISRDDL